MALGMSLMLACSVGATAQTTAALVATVTPAPRTWRIMPMGDSLTAGAGLDGYQSYRGHLYNKLIAAGYKVDFVGSRAWAQKASGDTGDLDHEGHGGFTIGPDPSKLCSGETGLANLYDNVERYLKTDPDIVLLLIGINDLLHTSDSPECNTSHGVNPADAPGKLERLVARILTLRPKTKVLLASVLPVPWGDERGYANSPVFKGINYQKAINDRAAQIANKQPGRVYFVDAFSEVKFIKGDWADIVHTTDAGAAKLANVWFQHLVPVLNNATPSIPTIPTVPSKLNAPTIQSTQSTSSTSSGQLIPNGTYIILAASATERSVVNVGGGVQFVQDGAWVFANHPAGTANEQWQFTQQGNNVYKIAARHSNKLLSVGGAAKAAGAQVTQQSDQNGQEQLWRAERITDGVFRLVALHSGQALTALSENGGLRLVQQPVSANPTQRWRIELVK